MEKNKQIKCIFKNKNADAYTIIFYATVGCESVDLLVQFLSAAARTGISGCRAELVSGTRAQAGTIYHNIVK